MRTPIPSNSFPSLRPPLPPSTPPPGSGPATPPPPPATVRSPHPLPRTPSPSPPTLTPRPLLPPCLRRAVVVRVRALRAHSPQGADRGRPHLRLHGPAHLHPHPGVRRRPRAVPRQPRALPGPVPLPGPQARLRVLRRLLGLGRRRAARLVRPCQGPPQRLLEDVAAAGRAHLGRPLQALRHRHRHALQGRPPRPLLGGQPATPTSLPAPSPSLPLIRPTVSTSLCVRWSDLQRAEHE